jgi:PAS domain S-box-containing protein
MHIEEIAASLMALCGAFFLTIAILRSERTRRNVPLEVQRRWRVMLVLMIFFLLGYLGFVAILVTRTQLHAELVTGMIFMAGAIFVYIVINLTRDTIARIKTAEEKLKELNETLEHRIQKRTAELQRSHTFLKTVLDNLSDSVMIIDAKDLKIVGVNASFLKEFGAQAEEVIGRTCHEITHHLLERCHPPDHTCPLVETGKAGTYRASEHVHYANDGTKHIVEITVSPIRDDSGSVVQFVHVSRDITEQRRAEEILQENEKRYRMLFESAGDAIFIMEAEGEDAGKIVALNKTAAEMHGYTVDELMHKNIREIDTPESAQNVPNLISRILGGEWIKSQEVTHRRKNGTVFFAEVSAGLMELGNHKYVLAFDRDIMDRKKAEEMLLHTQQTLQKILSSTPYGVVVMGMDKKVRSANKAALALMGYDSEGQIIGAICNKSFCLNDDDTCPIIDLHGTVDQTENILITKDGKSVPVLKTAVPVEIDGEQVLLEAFVDISNQKNAEQKLQRYAMELKQSNEDVLSFAYIVSHDLRAPLVSIKGFASELQYALKDIESVLDQCMPHLSEKERAQIATTYRKDVPEAMDFIKSSVSRMDGLINAILLLSRLGHRELKPEPINMRELTKSIFNSLAHQIEQRKTVVTIGELPTITADKLAMEQIMGNLLDNALKYLDPVREGEISISAEQNGEEIVFHISDNGRGIAHEDMHKVFEIFRRAGKPDVPGEGMGLAYVKTLVRRQGGRIWCESEPGKGAIFSFTIPHASDAHESILRKKE